MIAEELYLKDGRPSGAWYCGECRRTATTQEDAERCCKPRVCTCGAECGRSWILCTACREAKQLKNTAERIEKAKKIPAKEWDGPVVPEGTDGFASLDEALDHFNGCPVPTPIWGTRPVKMQLYAGGVIDWAVEDMYDGARDHIEEDAAEKLQDLLDAWVAEYGPPDGWEEDNSIVIVMDKC